jgi:hypothetical protein
MISTKLNHSGWQRSTLYLLLAGLLFGNLPGSQRACAAEKLAVVVGKEAPAIELFAAKELQQILTRLSGTDVTVGNEVQMDADVAFFLGSPNTNPALRRRFAANWPELSDQGIWLRSVTSESRRGVIVGGGSPTATLWASYELGYQLGVRYLLREDIYPEPTETLALDNLKLLAEPNLRSRGWRTINDFAIGPESWSLAEHKKVLGQLAKLRFNHIMMAVYPWQPFIHYKLDGVAKQTGMLWYGDRFDIPRGSPGRNGLQGLTVFENPEFAGKTSYEEMIAAGNNYVKTIIAESKRLGMTTGIAISPLEFPREFASVVPGAEPARGLNQLTVMPGARTRFDDPKLLQLIANRIHAYVMTYEGLDLLYLSLPEFPEWEGFADEAWAALAQRKGIKLPALDSLVKQAEDRNLIASAERGRQALRGNVVALAMLDLLMEKHPGLLERADDSRVKLVVRSVDPELFPFIDKLLPAGADTLNFVDYTARRVDENSQYLKTIPTDKISARFIATLADDNVGTLSQVTTRRLESIVGKLRKNGWDGFTTRYWMLAELDPAVHFLSRAAWDPEVTARSAHDELFSAITGKQAAADRLWLALGHIEKATELIDKHQLGFCFPVKGMLMKHHQATPAPEWWDEVNESYTQAMLELYRSHDASDPRCRKLLFYWAKRSEYVLEYLGAVKAVREAALLREKGDVEGASEQYGMAIEQLYNSIDTLSDVVRDQGDRGLIATLIKFAYQPLLAEVEEFESKQD